MGVAMIFASLGALFWVVSVTSLGLIFSEQLERIALRWGGWLVAVLAGGLAAYVLWKFIQRRRFLRRLRIARITPKELMDKINAGENISIVDLRQPMDIEAFPQMIPGALRIPMEEIEERHGEIPRVATSFSTVRDPMKRPAPGWRCSYDPKESPGFARSKAGSTPG